MKQIKNKVHHLYTNLLLPFTCNYYTLWKYENKNKTMYLSC